MTDCGCTIESSFDTRSQNISYCPLHEAAEELRDALEGLMEDIEASTLAHAYRDYEPWIRALSALAAASGEEVTG